MKKNEKKNGYEVLKREVVEKNTNNPFVFMDQIEELTIRLPNGKILKTRVARILSVKGDGQ